MVFCKVIFDSSSKTQSNTCIFSAASLIDFECKSNVLGNFICVLLFLTFLNSFGSFNKLVIFLINSLLRVIWFTFIKFYKYS